MKFLIVCYENMYSSPTTGPGSSPSSSLVKHSPASAGDAGEMGSVPKLGRSPGEENSNPLQYSCLGNPMDRGAWQLQSMRSQRVGHHCACTHATRVQRGSLYCLSDEKE